MPKREDGRKKIRAGRILHKRRSRLRILVFPFTWSAADSTGHPSQSSTGRVSRGLLVRRSDARSSRERAVNVSTLEWLEWSVASAVLRLEVKRRTEGAPESPRGSRQGQQPPTADGRAASPSEMKERSFNPRICADENSTRRRYRRCYSISFLINSLSCSLIVVVDAATRLSKDIRHQKVEGSKMLQKPGDAY